MEMTNNALLIPVIKRVAKNAFDIAKKRDKVKESIEALEAKYKAMLEEKKAKLLEEYESLVKQQELIEAPIYNITGYHIKDLVEMKVTETGTDKNGRPTRNTTYALRYPETIVPPEKNEAECNESGCEVPFVKVEDEPSKEDGMDEIPF